MAMDANARNMIKNLEARINKAADMLDKEAIRIYEEDGKVGMSVVFATIAKALRGEE